MSHTGNRLEAQQVVLSERGTLEQGVVDEEAFGRNRARRNRGSVPARLPIHLLQCTEFLQVFRESLNSELTRVTPSRYVKITFIKHC